MSLISVIAITLNLKSRSYNRFVTYLYDKVENKYLNVIEICLYLDFNFEIFELLIRIVFSCHIYIFIKNILSFPNIVVVTFNSFLGVIPFPFSSVENSLL